MEIVGMGHSGEGIGKVEDFTVFVPGALPGENISTQITLVKKKLCARAII